LSLNFQEVVEGLSSEQGSLVTQELSRIPAFIF
jgi:hypothetical protein